ncbi:uncharacterized protein LOC118745576 [Rhagoletis pomonella]|uniref:uncharacterized protein LOC118745576 n=1 Tax=Rhagoletis pomonella TaxID=28610 RepID=UPI0017805687|nr:uncharacterized protein LOC118745576 [Rhagoletis pomonella]
MSPLLIFLQESTFPQTPSINESPNVNVGQITAQVSRSIAVELPSVSGLRKNIQRQRLCSNPQLLTPKTLSELVIPEQFQLTNNGENFILKDSSARANRYVVFGTMGNLRRLGSCRIWMSDGTFSSVSSIFKQLYTIHGGLVDNDNAGNNAIESVPFVYVLLPCKRQNVYRRFLKALVNVADGHLVPEVFTTDFEAAFIGAVKKVFPDTHLHGCYFHFAQCIVRFLNNMGLETRYNTDDEFSLHAKMLIALAFVPPAFVVAGFTSLISSEYFANTNDLKPLITYFQDTWIGVQRRNGHTSAKFPIETWNCYYVVINNEPRTNNMMEGWHNTFHQRIGRSYEQLGKFINALRVEQASSEVIWEQFNAGRLVATRKRKKYFGYDARIRGGGILEYLRGVAHSVSP